jgi:hypothetical protein
VLGGTAALVVSFAVLVLAWLRPRYEVVEGAGAGRPAPAALDALVRNRATTVALRVVGLAVGAFTVWCLLAGPDDVAVNPVFGIVYVVLWVGLVPASLLLGPVVRELSPLRTVHALVCRALGRDPRRGLGGGRLVLPSWVGLWPGALALLSFTWIELVSPTGTTLATLGAWLGGYVVVLLVGAFVVGDEWFARADPFEVYATLVSHLSPWMVVDGRLRVVSPLRHLARVPVVPGLVAVVAVLLGSTAFDSYRESTSWLRFTQDNPDRVVALETLLLGGACALVGAVFALATAAPRPRDGVDRSWVPARLAHSVVPIVVGYMVAHYLTLLVETGQLTLIQASDPLGTGLDLFGTADRRVDLWLSLHPTFLATLKVGAIVLGHVVGVVAAHDRALALLPRRSEVSGQLPLLAVMVAFTFGGLYLIFGL